jgi:hypothetical protein
MSRTATDTTMILVDIVDRDGIETGRSIPVMLDYLKDVDFNYGEDADGNRGSLLVEYEILRAYIDLDDRHRLTQDEAQRAIADAEAIFNSSQKHFV